MSAIRKYVAGVAGFQRPMNVSVRRTGVGGQGRPPSMKSAGFIANIIAYKSISGNFRKSGGLVQAIMSQSIVQGRDLVSAPDKDNYAHKSQMRIPNSRFSNQPLFPQLIPGFMEVAMFLVPFPRFLTVLFLVFSQSQVCLFFLQTEIIRISFLIQTAVFQR